MNYFVHSRTNTIVRMSVVHGAETTGLFSGRCREAGIQGGGMHQLVRGQ